MKTRRMILTAFVTLAMITTVSASTDVDGDGLHEDVDGDGIFNIHDVTTLFEKVSEDNTDNLDYDFNNDGTVDAVDVQALFNEGGFATGDLNDSQDIDGDGYDEDINGDGEVTAKDVAIFYDNFEEANDSYDFNGDGNVDVVDVQKLYVESGMKTSPEIGDESPEDESVIETSYEELSGDGTVTLKVNVTDPAAGDVNVTFYNATDDQAIGSNDSYGPDYSVSWDVDTLAEHQWYAIAEDSQGNTTESSTYSFETQSSDTEGPEITFESTPSGTILDKSVSVEGSLSEEGKIEYKVDDGNYQRVDGGFRTDFQFDINSLSNGDHTVTVRSEDRAGNTGTKTFSFEIADGSEVEFEVAVDKSYPQSGIPIDPDSNTYDRDTDVDFDFTLERGGNTIDISSSIEDGVCDLRGNEGWQLGNDQYCGTKVPSDIQTGVDYDLVVEWELMGENHRRLLDQNFPISDAAQWYTSQSSSHGGRVEDSVSADMSINGESKQVDNGEADLATCTGSSQEVTGISNIVARCSNGATSGGNKPPMVAFISRNGQYVDTANNDMFNDPDCKIEDGITRQTLFGDVGSRGDDGYYPPGCSMGWHLGGDQSFTAYNYDTPGEYDINLDYINAISDSPSYICPGNDNNDLCSFGSIAQDPQGWKAYESKEVIVVDTDASASESELEGDRPADVEKAQVNGNTYIRRVEDYDGKIYGEMEVENDGYGAIEVTNFNIDCPDGVDCEIVSELGQIGEISGGESVQLTWSADPEDRTDGEINIEVEYDDVYGLDCSPSGSQSETFYLDEEAPETGEEVN